MSSNDENPYEVLNVDAVPVGDSSKSPFSYAVEGNLIVCGKFLTLPEVCVFTGSTTDLIVRTVRAHYSPFRLVLMQRTCVIRYFVAGAERSRIWWIRVKIGSVYAVGILIAIVGSILDLDYLWLIGLVLNGVFLIADRLLAPSLVIKAAIVNYQRPGIYWIKGFPKPFLKILAEGHANVQDAQEFIGPGREITTRL